MIRYTGINHLAMATKDMGCTILFWRDLLGMRLVAGLGRSGSRIKSGSGMGVLGLYTAPSSL